MLKGSRAPTRAEYNQLKADCEQLRQEIDALRQRIQEQSHELKVQFTRIAEIQATLDEERMSDVRAHPQPPTAHFPAERLKSQA